MNKLITNKISSSELKAGMSLKTWTGNKTILKLKEYNGSLNFIRNIIIFTDGTEMSNENHACYNLIVDCN